MSTTKEKIAVMQAFDEGEPIEIKNIDKTWRRARAPTWNWNEYEYRIAQVPEEVRNTSPLENKIAVMQAFNKGKPIEFQDSVGIWRLAGSPTWDWSNYTYRVKQEPRTWYLVNGAAYTSRVCAEDEASRQRVPVVEVREVLP